MPDRIARNGVWCLGCNTVVWSEDERRMVSCPCGLCRIGGGFRFVQRVMKGERGADWREMLEMVPDRPYFLGPFLTYDPNEIQVDDD